MAGHSQFKNIMHRKGAQDAKRAKVFTRFTKEIVVAVKQGGADPAANPRLRLAVQAARKENMPNDNIKRAIAKADPNSGDGAAYEEMRYEGYGPGHVAVIVETLTDNRNRTASEVRNIFSKNGGSMGETNSVAFNFERVGHISYPAGKTTSDQMLEAAIEAGAMDVESRPDGHDIFCAPQDLHAVLIALEKKFGEPEQAKLNWRPLNTVEITDEEKAKSFLKFLEAMDDLDDVQNVYANFNMSETLMEKLN